MFRCDDVNSYPCLDALDRARNVLVSGDLGCVEGVNTAWQLLDQLPLDVIPAALQGDWAALCTRADNLAEAGCGSLGATVIEEAGDIGSIILFMVWLLRHNLSADFARDLREPASLADAVTS